MLENRAVISLFVRRKNIRDGALIDRDRNDLEKLLIEQFGLQSLYLDYTWSVAVSKPDTLRKICNYNWFQDGEGG